MRTGLVRLLPLVAALAVAGCGGAGVATSPAQRGRGRLVVQVRWPASARPVEGVAAPRVVPDATRSFVVSVSQDGQTVGSATVTGGATTATLECPVGSVTLLAEAHATADGTGPVLARAQGDATIAESASSSATLNLVSTIVQVIVDTTDLDLLVGDPSRRTHTIAVEGRDAQGTVIPIGSGDLTFSSDHTTIASVSSAGLVTAVDVGTTYVHVNERLSGYSGTIRVRVN